MILYSDPILRGNIDLQPTEMCYVQYLPIKMAEYGNDVRVPAHLAWVQPLIDEMRGLISLPSLPYVYLTAKHFYVNRATDQCRAGWHVDGFGTDDINVIWCDKSPTIMCRGWFNVREGHQESMEDMERQAGAFGTMIFTYPEKSIVILTNQEVHKVNPAVINDYRTFVKLSFSEHKYALKGNAHNYLFDYDWEMKERQIDRNCPVGGKE